MQKNGLDTAGVSCYLRALRTLFIAAMDRYNDEARGIDLIKHYPFRKFKIKEDVGDETKVTGTLEKGITNSDLYTSYMCDLDPLSDDTCTSCSCFPICNGGCAFRRLKNKGRSIKEDLCTIQKGYMDKFIKLYYESLS